MANIEPRSRAVLTSLGFWVVIAYFVLAFVVVWLYVLNGREARAGAARAASIKSAATAQVSQCFTSVRNFPLTKGFVDGQLALIDNSLIGSRSALKAQPNSPLTQTRKNSIRRLTRDRAAAVKLQNLILKNTPTKKKCLALAAKLRIDPQPFEKG